jgi:hypothetical protein
MVFMSPAWLYRSSGRYWMGILVYRQGRYSSSRGRPPSSYPSLASLMDSVGLNPGLSSLSGSTPGGGGGFGKRENSDSGSWAGPHHVVSRRSSSSEESVGGGRSGRLPTLYVSHSHPRIR